MRPIILAALLLALSCVPVMAADDSGKTESSRVYDAKGRYQAGLSSGMAPRASMTSRAKSMT